VGYYLNARKPCTLFREILESPYFVDKTHMINELVPLIGTSSKYICITRPRRFGKTVAANMISAFLGREADSKELFSSLEVARNPEWTTHLNRYHVIFIDFSKYDDLCTDYASYIGDIKELLREDLHRMYPDIQYRKRGSVSEDLLRIHEQTKDQFVFVMDEWDAIFHMPFIQEGDKKRYLLFLRDLLKDQPYVAFAYLTGILPIAKYSSGSELNMFLEYTMISEARFSDCFGFTEREVDLLYERYKRQSKSPAVTRDELRKWYDGYHTSSGERVYNPRSVVAALTNNNSGNYWTSSGPYDEISYYLKYNIDAVRDALAIMAAGERVPAKIREYAATSMNLQTRDEIFSAMVVYGFLSYEDGCVFIPNRELMDQFADMLQKESSLGYVHRLARESERMLKATFAGDCRTMAEILSYVHDTETPILSYNSEIELSSVVTLAYLSARNDYEIEREDKAGKGYVDFIFYPKRKNDTCLILELKVDHTPEEALEQIYQKQYALRFIGKLGEERQYTGNILAVGIGYDKESKEHRCKVETIFS